MSSAMRALSSGVRAGMPLSCVDSPAAIVDLAALETNVRAALAHLPHGVTLRPHAKSHKCAQIALLQIKESGGGTVGVCCQKVVEVEAMIAAGVKDVLLSNEVVDPPKIEKLVSLAVASPSNRISVLVDNASAAAALSDRAMARGIVMDVLIEVDVGQKRCGVVSVEEALALARDMTFMPGVRLCGIQCYHGAAQHVRSFAERKEIVHRVSTIAASVRDALRDAGFACDIVTGGGTGTFPLEAATGVFTEVQPGSYIFNDADYARNCDEEGKQCWTSPWLPSLYLLTQVMSRRVPGEVKPGSPVPAADAWVVVDSGLKAQSTDSGNPVVVATVDEYCAAARSASADAAAAAAAGASHVHGPSIAYDAASGRFVSSVGHLLVKSVSDEHSTLVTQDAHASFPGLATKLLLMPGHCDPFVNHYNELVAVRGGVVEDVWTLHARSPGL